MASTSSLDAAARHTDLHDLSLLSLLIGLLETHKRAHHLPHDPSGYREFLQLPLGPSGQGYWPAPSQFPLVHTLQTHVWTPRECMNENWVFGQIWTPLLKIINGLINPKTSLPFVSPCSPRRGLNPPFCFSLIKVAQASGVHVKIEQLLFYH